MNVLRRIPERPHGDTKMTLIDVVCEGDGSMTEFSRLRRQQNVPICTGFDGSDGTRTRDLRRDRCVETVASGFA